MKVLDIDLDFFLDKIAGEKGNTPDERLDSNYYTPWEKKKVIEFIEEKLVLNKQNKIRGRIIEHHDEALKFWMERIESKQLKIPFYVVHVDAHADLGMGGTAFEFIHKELLSKEINQRRDINEYENIFKNPKKPLPGDYLLYAIAFRYIKKLIYVYHKNLVIGQDKKQRESLDNEIKKSVCKTLEGCNKDVIAEILNCGIDEDNKYEMDEKQKQTIITDIPDNIMKNYDGNSNVIQLTCIEDFNLRTFELLRRKEESEKIWEKSAKETEVELKTINENSSFVLNCKYDFITFCKSPNYTPETADFIIDIFKEYIEEI